MNLYTTWKNYRIDHLLEEEMDMIEALSKPLSDLNADEINFWIPKYISDIRKADGSKYPDDSLVSIVSGIQRSLSINGVYFNFFKDPKFRLVNETLDTEIKSAAQNGIAIVKRHSAVIEVDEEEKIWNSEALGDDSPEKLMKALFYLNGLHFALTARGNLIESVEEF